MIKDPHPITKEIQRQLSQGFLEPKRGVIFSPHFYFDIEGFNYPDGKLQINKWVDYKTGPNSINPNFTMEELIMTEPPASYKPFQNLMFHLGPLVGESGKTNYSTYFKLPHEEEGTSIEGENGVSIERAIKNFRIGTFDHNSDEGNRLALWSDHNPFNHTGRLLLTFPQKNWETYMHEIDQAVKYLQSLKLVNTKELA